MSRRSGCSEESHQSRVASRFGIPQFPYYQPRNPSNGQVHPANLWLLKRWKVLHRAIDDYRYDILVVAEPTPCISVWCIRVEVPNVVRMHVRVHDARAVGEDSVR